jgi:8-oxo-dGTP pyrophosphatase MutT (NUDIX family)
MHRRPFLRLLETYREQHADEADTIDRFERFVNAHQDCFERSCPPGHLTGSAFLVDSDAKSLLLTHHRKLDTWLQLGGHADGDPDMLQVALKEAEEESGLDATSIEALDVAIFDLDIHPIPTRGEDPEHLHYDVRFLLRHAGSGDYIVSDESHDLAWAPLKTLETYTTEESIVRMAQKFAQR